MEDQTISAGVQYGDLKGNVAIDGHNGSPLFDIAKEFGINTNEYFPISIGMYKEGEHETFAIDTVKIASTSDGILAYLKEHPESLPVYRSKVEASFEQIFQKRVSPETLFTL